MMKASGMKIIAVQKKKKKKRKMKTSRGCACADIGTRDHSRIAPSANHRSCCVRSGRRYLVDVMTAKRNASGDDCQSWDVTQREVKIRLMPHAFSLPILRTCHASSTPAHTLFTVIYTAPASARLAA